MSQRKRTKWCELYTDGSCLHNPGGPGGWGVILRYHENTKEMLGWCCRTTSNRMEMMGVLEGLRALKRSCLVWIYTDSQYVYNCATGRYKRHKNKDLWALIDKEVTKNKRVEWSWVRGHAGHEENERADTLAKQGSKQAQEYRGADEGKNCCGKEGCLPWSRRPA